MKPWQDVTPPGPIYAQQLNELAREVERLSRLIVDGGDLEDVPGGRILRIPKPRERYVVKVYADEDSPADGCTTQAYRWVRQVPAACGVQGDEAPTPVTGSVSTNNPAYEPNGATIADGTVVEIIPGAAYLDSGGNVVQEWIILRGGGTAAGVEVVRIESWFVKDHAGATGCNGGPSPACFYPGVPQKWDCVNRYTDDASKEKVWVDLTFSDQAPVQGVGGAPATTVVTATGNTRILAKSLGKRYRPDEGVKVPPNPFNDQERPVYGSDSIACLIIMNCGTPPGGIQSGEGG